MFFLNIFNLNSNLDVGYRINLCKPQKLMIVAYVLIALLIYLSQCATYNFGIIQSESTLC